MARNKREKRLGEISIPNALFASSVSSAGNVFGHMGREIHPIFSSKTPVSWRYGFLPSPAKARWRCTWVLLFQMRHLSDVDLA